MARRQRKNHRQKVGGLWGDMGPRQLRFLVGEGLDPSHYLLDVGCGSLRGGVQFIGYLEDGHYFGIDKDAHLIAAGVDVEMPKAGVADAKVHLTVTDAFEIPVDWPTFDYAIAQSVFTHLPAAKVEECFAQLLGRVDRFYATYWPTTTGRPYAYDPPHLEELAQGWSMSVIGDWGHPRGQHIALFE